MTTTVTSTIRSSGGDYTTLSAWEAANQGNLVTADEVRVAECYNDWPSGLNDAVNIDGSTTDATRYMAITVAAGHRHTGKPDTGFRIVRSAAYIAVVLFNDPYCRASWLDVRNTGTEGTAVRQNGSNGSNSRASRCIGRTTGTAPYVSCFSGLAYTYQCLAIGGIQGFQGTGTYGTFEMVGCVASGSTTGFQLDSPGTAKRVANCVAYNCTTNYTGTFDAALSGNNASTSGTMPGSSNVSGISSADFVDAAGHDYHLAGGSALIGMGANLYTLITEDVDGDAWPSSGAWDIGFDYRVSSGTNTDSAAGSGAVELTGSAANATRELLSAASGSSIVLTGSSANAIKSVVANAESGSVVLTGSNAAALRTLIGVASSGSIVVTGSDASGAKESSGNIDAAAESGSVLITGSSANAVRTLLATADSGSVILTGSAASGAKTILGVASSGSIVVTGVAASASRTYLGIAGSGAIVVTGSAATGSKSAALSLSPADIQAIVDALMSDPRMLTLPKWIALR